MTGKEWYAMKGRNNTWTDMAVAAAFAAVLGISAFWGQHDRAYDQAGTAGSAYGRMYNQAGPADEDGGPAGKAGAYPGTAGAAQAAEGAGEEDVYKRQEYSTMKRHVEASVEIIRHLPSMDYVIPAVLGHHERYDGRGYPRRIAGKDIPLAARILCIADSFRCV